ncbi:hypothetical protein [Robertmurraya sp.]|uniref:hypothetical protein n=1 Tax=Robertmurraya sp. TaxID=2837525 RepID=UPI003704CF29
MEVLFRFKCTCCEREVLSDAVIIKCCGKLMVNEGHLLMTHEEVHNLYNEMHMSVS